MKDRVEDELELAAARTQDGIESCFSTRERVVCLTVDREDRHRQTGGQAHRNNRHGRRQRVLPEAAPHERHQAEAPHTAAAVAGAACAAAARLSCARSSTRSNAASTVGSWL